ncbi:hypothetical protein ACF0H5_021877 [Mactra antiquata]
MMSTPSENEIFAQLKSMVLNENRSLLCSNIEPKLHYPYLRSKLVLCKDNEEEIESQTTTKLKVHKLIDLLIQRPMGYDHLVKSIIQEKIQIFIAEKLNKDFEEKKKRLMAPALPQGDSHGYSSISSPSSITIKSVNESLPNRTSTEILYKVDRTSQDLDSLPKPVLNNKSIEQDNYQCHNKSCENSFYEGSIDEKLSQDSDSIE